jgi:hypothetical protein
MTYNSLVSDIEQWLNTTNAETIAQIPNFIELTHQEICREYVNLGYEQYVNGAFIGGAQSGGAVIPKPARWRRNISFTYGSGTNFNTVNSLELRSYEYVRDYAQDPTVLAPPLFYADYGFTHWLIGPTPDDNYPFQIGYLEMPVPINENQQTNWLTDYAPDALLWGSLCKAIPFLKDDERIPMWEARYEKARQTLDLQDKANFVDRGSNRGAD